MKSSRHSLSRPTNTLPSNVWKVSFSQLIKLIISGKSRLLRNYRLTTILSNSLRCSTTSPLADWPWFLSWWTTTFMSTLKEEKYIWSLKKSNRTCFSCSKHWITCIPTEYSTGTSSLRISSWWAITLSWLISGVVKEFTRNTLTPNTFRQGGIEHRNVSSPTATTTGKWTFGEWGVWCSKS